jgi:hypothetical protein
MPIEMARKLVKRLLAGYPNLGAHDPDGYIAALISVMAEFPQWAGERSVLKVDAENSSFPPTEKELRKWLSDAVGPYRFAREWDARSKAQLEERKLLESKAPAADADEQRGTIYSNYDEAFRLHGKPLGPFDPGRTVRYRG